MGQPVLSIVVPVYNEQDGIGDCVDRLRQYLDSTRMPWEIVVVDDGSTDGTVHRAQALAAQDPRVRLHRALHRGKGAAVRQGMLAASGAWRFMADADLSMPPEQIGRFLQSLRDRASALHVVIGSREAPGARRVGEPWRRHAVGRAFNWLVQALLLPGVQDSQCGFKLFSAAAVNAVFPHTTIDGFAIDVEVLLLSRKAGFRVREVGIEWHCRHDSRVSVWRGAAAFLEVLRVRWTAWTGGYRGVGPSPHTASTESLDAVARYADVR